VICVNPPASEDLGSAAQRDRRRRILDATVALASRGGFDAVQMRTVAERADVALGTLYRYFPSKLHLLVSALAREFEAANAGYDRMPVTGDTPADRVMFVLDHGTRALRREPQLTEALTRAFMFADASVGTEIQLVVAQVNRMFLRALQPPGGDGVEPTEEEAAIVKVIADVWLASLVQWVTGRASASDVSRSTEVAVRLLMR
jgi:AcrR family transcriptional regulator